MDTVVYVLLATSTMSLLSISGGILLFLKTNLFERLLKPLVAFSAGTLLGAAFLHLIPEALSGAPSPIVVFIWLLAGYLLFLIMEQVFNYQHHHTSRDRSAGKRPVTYLLIFADSIHNFVDGMAIAGSFLISPQAGLITAVAAAAHEIPQELGDFSVLVYGGWERRKALLFNFISSLTVVAGGLVVLLLAQTINTSILLPFAAGNFLYIAASDLIPEIQRGGQAHERFTRVAAFLLGLLLLLIVKIVLPE